MIGSFKHKGLRNLFEQDDGRKVSADQVDRLRLILISTLQVDKAVFFSAVITVAAFVPLFTMQGVEGQIFGPMAKTYAYALIGSLVGTFTLTPVLSSLILPDHVEEELIDLRLMKYVKDYLPPDWRTRGMVFDSE